MRYKCLLLIIDILENGHYHCIGWHLLGQGHKHVHDNGVVVENICASRKDETLKGLCACMYITSIVKNVTSIMKLDKFNFNIMK